MVLKAAFGDFLWVHLNHFPLLPSKVMVFPSTVIVWVFGLVVLSW